MAANGAKYGVATVHFYWIGAVPAMVFLGIVMMPFYYGSKVRSVPEYLRLRFDEARTRSTPDVRHRHRADLGREPVRARARHHLMLGWSIFVAILVAAASCSPTSRSAA